MEPTFHRTFPSPRFPSVTVSMACLAAVVGTHAQAAQTYMDGSALNTWNAFDPNWDAGVIWTDGGDAVFAGTGEPVTVGTVSAHNLTFDVAGYSLTGGALTLTGISPTITANADTTIGSTIAGSAGLIKAGSGMLTLTGNNTYTGDTIVSAGLLRFESVGSFASPTVANNAAVYFYRGGGGQTNLPGKLTGSGTWTVDGPGGGDQWANRVVLQGIGSDNSGSISVVNSGKLWSDLRFSSNPIGDTADVSVDTSAVLNFYGPAGTKETIGGLNGSGTVDFSDGGGGKALTLEVGGGDKTGFFDGVIANSGTSLGPTVLSFSKIGGGTQALNGVNTYTGTTTVNGGTLQVNGSLGTGAVTVNAGALLTGSGTIGGSVTVQSGGTLTRANISGALTVAAGGTLSPGGSGAIETIDVTGVVELSGNSAFGIQKSGTTLAGDLLQGASSITYGGDLTVTATGDNLAEGDSFQLFSATGTYGGVFASFTLPGLPAGLSWETSTLPIDGRITVVNHVGSPVFNPAAGAYVGAQSVTITSDSGSTIRYTLDGSDPLTSGTAVTGASPLSGIAIAVDAVVTLKACATKSGLAASPMTEATYATASTAVWNVDNNGLWSESANWLNGVIPNVSNAPVDFHTMTQTGPTTVTLDSNRTVGSMTFGNINNFDWTVDATGGSALTLAGTSPEIAVLDNTATVSAAVAGSQGLLKSGPGSLVLSAANTFSGTTTVSGGVLSTGSLTSNGGNSGIGTGTDLVLNGGTLRYTGGNNGSDAGAKFDRNISVGAGGGTLDIGGTGFLFYGGTLTGSGTLKVIDSSGDTNNRQLLVTGNSPAFTGNIEIGNGSANSGWVQYRSNAASPFGSGTITILTGGVLSSDNGSTSPATLANPIILSGGTLRGQGSNTNYSNTVTAATGTTSFLFSPGGANLAIGGQLLGNGTLIKSDGSFSVALSGDNSGFSGTYHHTADGATILYTANSGSAAASWGIPTGSNAAARFLAAAASATYKLGALSGATGRLENLNAASGNSVFEIGALGTDTSFAGVIRNGGGGTVGITKVGAGKLTLAGANLYTGSTVVNGGTLELGSTGSLTFVPAANHVVNGISGSGAVNLDGAFVINLTGASTTPGNSWLLVDVANLTETYGSNFSVSGFTEPTPGIWTRNDGIRTWTFTESTGELGLEGGGYASWIASYFAGETNPAIIGSDADPDGDGVANGIEFLTGTIPNSNASRNAPLITRNGSGNLVVSFPRADAAESYAVTVEHSTTLQAPWSSILVPNDAIAAPPVTVVDNGTAPDDITVVIPASGDPRHFARVRIEIPAVP